MRQEFSKKTKLARFNHTNGHCEECGCKIVGVAEYDHDKEDYIGGDNSFENCRVLCGRCHKRKTKKNRPQIDKTRRIIEKRAGVRKSDRPMRKAPENYDTFNRRWRDE